MSAELAWVSGDTKYLQVHLRDAKIDASHYFCFPTERARTKLGDVEPLHGCLATLSGTQMTIYLSRLHHWGLVVWTNPEIHQKNGESRPLCCFAWSVHTPCVDTERQSNPPWMGMRVSDSDGLNPFQRAGWWLGERFFSLAVNYVNKQEYGPYPNCWIESKSGGLTENQLFDRKSIVRQSRHILLIGLGPNVDLVRTNLCNGSSQLTRASLDAFLQTLGVP